MNKSVSEQLEQPEKRKSSFLTDLVPDVYDFANTTKPFALIYASVLSVFFVLSTLFHSTIIKYFIDFMVGWTIPSLLFIVAIIVLCDIKVSVRTPNEISSQIMPKRYKFSMYWSFFLCIIGVAYLYLTSQYKKEYDFECSNFYLEDSTGIYHIWNDCNYIGKDEDGNPTENKYISKIKGYELNDWHTPCIACKERAEDYEGNFEY